jgi:hypothetical protein
MEAIRLSGNERITNLLQIMILLWMKVVSCR